MIEQPKLKKSWAFGWLAVAALSLVSARAYAQASVKGSIFDETRSRVVGSSVLVKDADTGSIKAAPEAPKGEYVIPAIALGKYDFIACGMPFRPTHTSVNLVSEQTTTINLVLDDPYDAPKIKLAPDHMEDSTDKILYLRDAKSGCLVAQAQPNSKGQYQFTNWHTGDELCVRKSRKNKGGEEYECQTLKLPSIVSR